MNKQVNNEWLKEYQEFMNSDTTSVPDELTKNIFSKMTLLLKPNAWMIFLKIIAIHLVIGTLSLGICHQFGLNPFHTESSLADWFMQIGGHGFCMIACGILFLGFSLSAAGFFLTIEEIKVLRNTQFLQTLALSIFSLGLLAAVGAELALTITGLWLFGTFLGGFLATEVIWQIRQRG